MKHYWFNKFSLGTLAASVVMSACGPQPFVPGSVNLKQSAGFMDIPPRVDVVLGMGMSGTMLNIFPGVATEVPSFATGLENSGWDYRFVSIPLHQSTPGSNFILNHNVSASTYHTNYVAFGQWKAPFPGATNTDPNLAMLSSLFSTTFILPQFNNPSIPVDGRENGLEDLVQFVSRGDVNTGVTNTGVLRPDAMLAVIVMSNDDDKSGGTWRCKWNPNIGAYPANCPDYNREWIQPAVDNLPAYRNALIAAKGGNPALVKYYALTAPATVYCRGYAARYGERYGVKFKNLMGGKTIDICANDLQSSLQQVAQDLVSQKLNFRKRYLVLQSKPNVGTIKVTKHTTSGDVVLVQGDPNGWSYVGGAVPQTVYTIDSPTPMAQATGYPIELFGTGRLIGDETADVDYMNEGAATSH